MTSARLLTASMTESGAEVPAASATPIRRQYMLATECSNPHATNAVIGKTSGENLIGHTPRAHAQPAGPNLLPVQPIPAIPAARGLAQHWFRRSPNREVQDQAMTPLDSPEPLSGTPRWLSLCHRTTSTEQFACCTTRVDTLPRRNRSMALSPLAPITIRSAWCSEATFMIFSAGFPS